MEALKPLDIIVALKLGLNERALRLIRSGEFKEAPSSSIRDLAENLSRSAADISRSLQRLLHSGLIGERTLTDDDRWSHNRKHYSLQRQGLSDLILYGVRYFFPPTKTGFGRGIPTGWNCPLVHSEMVPLEIPIVWAAAGGDAQGELLEPLYPGVPYAATRDDDLYIMLSMIEVIRTGKPRELKFAKEILHDRIMALHL